MMIKKHYKKIIIFLTGILLIFASYAFLVIEPEETTICFYNGMNQSYRTYIITDNELIIDTISDNNKVIEAIYSPIVSSRILLKPDLRQKAIPIKLFFMTSKTYGCPDCIDQGGIILKVKKFGVEKVFSIDEFKKEEFCDGIIMEIENRIKEINT